MSTPIQTEQPTQTPGHGRVTKGDRIREKYSDENSIRYKLREARSRHVKGIIDTIYASNGSCRIVDIGGEENYWRVFGYDYLSARNVTITLVNLNRTETTEPMINAVVGDGCDMPFADNSFDLAHSNSVVEHVGSWEKMVAFADEVVRLAPSYFVQTPNFWFPYEPHLSTPLIHYLPKTIQAKLALKLQLNAETKMNSRAEADDFIKHNSMLSYRQMRKLFPDCEILRERFLGITKSLMAIKPPR
jgi:hypothetical protein